MTEETGRGWILILAAMVLLTIGATVGYLAAPFDTPPAERVRRTGPHVVDPGHRIVGILEDGSLAILDGRTGSLSEIVVPGGMGSVDHLDVGNRRKTAYVGGTDDARPRLVHLRTGEEERIGEGRILTVGPVSFPQLDADIDRPEVEQLAFATTRNGVDRITVENLATGSRTVIGPGIGDPPFRRIDDLVASPFENRLFGIADGGSVVFALDADRARSLDDVLVTDPLPPGSRWIDATAYGDGVAAILRSSDGSTELVEIGRRRLEPSGPLMRADGTTLVAVDADESARKLLVTTQTGDLLRVEPDAGTSPTRLAGGIVRAAW